MKTRSKNSTTYDVRGLLFALLRCRMEGYTGYTGIGTAVTAVEPQYMAMPSKEMSSTSITMQALATMAVPSQSLEVHRSAPAALMQCYGTGSLMFVCSYLP